jgi:hypothetical protein
MRRVRGAWSLRRKDCGSCTLSSVGYGNQMLRSNAIKWLCNLLLFDVFCKTAVHGDACGAKVLTEKLVTTATIKASTALFKQ